DSPLEVGICRERCHVATAAPSSARILGRAGTATAIVAAAAAGTPGYNQRDLKSSRAAEAEASAARISRGCPATELVAATATVAGGAIRAGRGGSVATALAAAI